MNKDQKLDLADKLYITAVDDFNSSQILFDHKIYPNSIYHLQQSIEKLSKSYAIRFDLIEPNQLKKIGHEGYKILKEPSKKVIKEIDRFKRTFITSEAFEESLAESKDSANDFLELLNNLTASDLEELQTLKEIEEILLKIEGPEPTDEFNFHTAVEEHSKDILEIIDTIEFKDPLIPNEKSINEETNDYIKTFSQCFMIARAINHGLLWLNFLLTPHQNKTRYPAKPDFKSPKEKYMIEAPIVQKFNGVSEALQKTFILYAAFLEFIKQLNSGGNTSEELL